MDTTTEPQPGKQLAPLIREGGPDDGLCADAGQQPACHAVRALLYLVETLDGASPGPWRGLGWGDKRPLGRAALADELDAAAAKDGNLRHAEAYRLAAARLRAAAG